MKWIDSTQIAHWAINPAAKADLPLVVSRLIRATTPLDSSLDFPSGADTYSGGWDGFVRCGKDTGRVPGGISLWEMGTEKDSKGKADDDYKKRSLKPLGYVPADCTFVFVTPRKWNKKKTWSDAKKAEKKWKDVRVFDGSDLEQWMLDAPAVGWWFAVLSGNMPYDVILSAEQSWNDYAQSPTVKLKTQVLTCSRGAEVAKVCDFLHGPAGKLVIKARSREEAVAFILAAAMEQDLQAREDFLSKTMVFDNVQSFRTVANNRNSLVLIAKFENTEPLDSAVSNGHHVLLPLGADDSHGGGTSLDLPQIGRELEAALQASGLSPHDAHRFMVESGRDLTVLRRLLNFSHLKIKWATPEFSPLLLPALFLGRWDENKEGDRELLKALAGESYMTYIEKISRWRDDANPFVYQIGSRWRLTSSYDAWSLLARYITPTQLARFQETALGVLGQVQPLFDLEPGQRHMAVFFGKESIYSEWVREGVCHSLILFSMFGNSLRLPTGDCQQWVNELVGKLLQSDKPDFWRSLNRLMPLVAEAAPDKFLSTIQTSLATNPKTIMGMFQEDPSPLFPRTYHTGLLWALESLAWLPQYFNRAVHILSRLASFDPGGTISNRPINSLRNIFLPLHPMTFVAYPERFSILEELCKQEADTGWDLVKSIMPSDRQNVFPTERMRWRPFEVENSNQVLTPTEVLKSYSLLFRLGIPLAGLQEDRLTTLLNATNNIFLLPEDRKLVLDHLASIRPQLTDQKLKIITELRSILRRHRTYPNEHWSFPESVLTGYDNLLALYEPNTVVEESMVLFLESHPQLPEMASFDPRDYEAEEKLIHDKRVTALNKVYTESGISGLIDLAEKVVEKTIFGETAAFCFHKMEDQLQLIHGHGLACPEDFNAGAGFTFRSSILKGFGWIKEVFIVLKDTGTDSEGLTRFLGWSAPSGELYDFLETQSDEIIQGYWKKNRPWLTDLSAGQKVRIIERLLAVGRTVEAITQVFRSHADFSTKLMIQVLQASAQIRDIQGRYPRSHEIEGIFNLLYDRGDFDSKDLALTEWQCIHYISFSSKGRFSRLLYEELSVNPEFFVQVLSLLYKEEGDPAPPLKMSDADPKAILARNALTFLSDWRRLPGSDETGKIDPAALEQWIDSARSLAAESKRLSPADLYIGKILSYFRREKIYETPPEAVCQVIDRINTREIVSGFHTELFNQQGSSSRSPFEGGKREWAMAERHKAIAEELSLKWPVTASIYERLAEGYRHDAARIDQKAQQESLDS
ncbi:MAG: hypothetical protein P4L51_28230 [Puia sp.]|nr:hypothetical protein [Puia sp.]